jgi:heterodisulfide reductase subunit C
MKMKNETGSKNPGLAESIQQEIRREFENRIGSILDEQLREEAQRRFDESMAKEHSKGTPTMIRVGSKNSSTPNETKTAESQSQVDSSDKGRKVQLDKKDFLAQEMGEALDENQLIVSIKAILSRSADDRARTQELVAENNRLRRVIASMIESLGIRQEDLPRD